MSTMADVAKRAGVTLSTVSHALSGKRPVAAKTKQRILRAMADLDYQPHTLARGLATRRSGIVALVIPPSFQGLVESQFIFVASVAETVRKMGYNLLLWTAPSDNLEIMRMVQQGFVEGLILMEITLHDPRVDLLREKGYPFSVIGRREDNDGIDLVDLDFEYAIDLCVGHLAELGHRYIGVIGYSSAAVSQEYGPAIRTIRGFKQTMRNRGLIGSIRQCDPNSQAAYDVTTRLLKKHPSLSALVMVSETTLEGVVQAVRDYGLRIPHDFSVVAITSTRLAQLATLAVTGIDFPMLEMGQIGAEMLVQQLTDTRHQPRQIIMRPALTVRESTGPVVANRHTVGGSDY